MAGVMAASLRAGLPMRTLLHSRHFGTVIPMTDIEQMVGQSTTPRTRVWPPPHVAQGQTKDQPGDLKVGAASGMEEIKGRFDQAAAHHADLQSQLLAQQDLNAKHTKLIAESLEAAAANRAQLQGKIDMLYGDLHMLTAQMLKEQVGVRERVQRKGVKGRGGQSRMAYRPTIENAERQPTHVCEMSHQSLAEIAMLGNHCAMRERLLREIMAVDQIAWGPAHEVLNKMDVCNERFYWFESMPYRIGVTAAFVGGVLGSLMVFYKPVALWYGENIAGEELPEGVKDISEMTTNQVGTWTWSWMEPMIGTASFVLLCCQFTRAQVMKMNMKTYAEHLLTWRANRLAKQFPEYDGSMVRAWAKHIPPVGLDFFPIYERRAGYKGFTSGL